MANTPLFTGAEWDFGTIQRTHDAIQDIALNELGLDPYPVQLEVVSYEQMLDTRASVAMPIIYPHWSFGKHFAMSQRDYAMGHQGLPYETIINSNPSVCYIMEDNTATLQTLVLAHAAFGHAHFFKNNEEYLLWTDAKNVLDYFAFAKSYVTRCEQEHGEARVEAVLDAAHALWNQGITRYTRKPLRTMREDQAVQIKRQAEYEANFNDLWRTVPGHDNSPPRATTSSPSEELKRKLSLPEENVLYFLEKFAPGLEDWQRELLRIVRNIAQYFYPQSQTKMMNEGCATYVHYEIMERLHRKGLITDGSFKEFLRSHTNVAFQPDFDDKRFKGRFNPYALGSNMMHDIARICTNPTSEDLQWFPSFAGNNDPLGTLRDAWANYRDESFVLQFLSRHLIRKFRLALVEDDSNEPSMRVAAIHNEHGFDRIKKALARRYDVAANTPNIQIVAVDLFGTTRKLTLNYEVQNRILLDERDAKQVLQHLANLWGYDVELRSVESKVDLPPIVLSTITAKPQTPNPIIRPGHVGVQKYRV